MTRRLPPAPSFGRSGIEEVADKNAAPLPHRALAVGRPRRRLLSSTHRHASVWRYAGAQWLRQDSSRGRPYTQRSADENKERRTHALSAGAGDVFADFMHAAHVACKLSADIVSTAFMSSAIGASRRWTSTLGRLRMRSGSYSLRKKNANCGMHDIRGQKEL